MFYRKLLTISIPTWNRAELLSNLLSELTYYIEDLGVANEVEVLISNNNSEDNTEVIVKNFQEKYSFITYNRNEENIGAKNNVLKSMYLSNGEYVFFIGDDDRINKKAIFDLLSFLKLNKDAGVIIDTSRSKINHHVAVETGLTELLKNYYWYIGNAGYFILKSAYVKHFIDKYGYGFFNECWPQTQIIILTLNEVPEAKCYLNDFNIHSEGAHGEVMLYNSFYLWRTCYYELTNSIRSISDYIPSNVSSAAYFYLRTNIVQQVYNILQCGVFVDDKTIRKKTKSHIVNHLSLFTSYEKMFLIFIVAVLSLPSFISRPMSDFFIFILKGRKGLNKKSQFVESELKKKSKLRNSDSGSIRTLEFEIDN